MNKESLKEARHEYYLRNRDTILRKQRERDLNRLSEKNAYNRLYRMRNSERLNEYGLSRRAILRAEAIERLGAKCVRCGFSDIRALQFNHINGGGNKDVKTNGGAKFYSDVASGLRPDVELTCANCNWVHRVENGFDRGHKSKE